MLKIKNTVTEMENISNGHNSTLYMPEKKISDIENMSTEASNTEKAERKTMGGGTEENIQEPWDNYKKCNKCDKNTRRRRKLSLIHI